MRERGGGAVLEGQRSLEGPVVEGQGLIDPSGHDKADPDGGEGTNPEWSRR